MRIPKTALILLRELDDEYGDTWDSMPENDERLLKIRILLNIATPRTTTGRVEWTDEMDQYLFNNEDKTAREIGEHLGIDLQIVSRRRKRLGLSGIQKPKNVAGIIFTDDNGKESHYASVTDARIATKLPRRWIYRALKIGKEWRYA